jgi:predicted transcriptional regulator
MRLRKSNCIKLILKLLALTLKCVTLIHVKISRDEKAGASDIQNITLALPKWLLRKVKHLAVEREKSVSRLLTETLEELVTRNDAYAEARRRALHDLEHPRDFGTFGKITWTRDELHERR